MLLRLDESVLLGETAPTSLRGFGPARSCLAERKWRGLVRFRPRTELGRRLWAIRQEIIASGTALLDWEGIQRELAERRGEAEWRSG